MSDLFPYYSAEHFLKASVVALDVLFQGCVYHGLVVAPAHAVCLCLEPFKNFVIYSDCYSGFAWGFRNNRASRILY